MRVRALIGFCPFWADGSWSMVQPGDELEMPKGVDWLKKGLVEVVSTPSPPSLSARRERSSTLPPKKGEGSVELKVIEPEERAVSQRSRPSAAGGRKRKHGA
jgi:hypothetical protein